VCGILFVSAHNNYAESWVGYITLVIFGTEHKRSRDSGFDLSNMDRSKKVNVCTPNIRAAVRIKCPRLYPSSSYP